MEIQGEGHHFGLCRPGRDDDRHRHPGRRRSAITSRTPHGDGNDATSDAVFVFTGAAPAVAVGDAVQVTGKVAEFSADPGVGLTTTEIDAPTTTVLSHGNALPDAVLIGAGGRLPPSEVIDDDGLTSYDPVHDGIDFYESLEGMLVTVDNPLVIQSTNDFGETYVVASDGAGATGVAARGGLTLSAGDFNPERIQIDSLDAATRPTIPRATISAASPASSATASTNMRC